MEGFLYIIKWWVAFPTSEYGGLVVLSAKDDEEAVQFLVNQSQEDKLGWHGATEPEAIMRIPLAVANADKLKLDATECGKPPKIIRKFIT